MSQFAPTTRRHLVLGVDGGNTKTVALLAQRDGTVVGRGQSRKSDIYGAGSVEAGIQELMVAVVAATRAAGADLSDIEASVLSMAGADWPEDMLAIREATQELGIGGAVTVVNDAIGALRSGSARGPAVAVVCGTGAATGARSADGRLWHAGWWQEPQGAIELAQIALRAVYRAELGIDGSTSLTARLLEMSGHTSVEEFLHAHTRRDSVDFDFAGTTCVLFDEAQRGDAVALRVVRGHGHRLAEYALAAARTVRIVDGPFDLVLAGGVLRNESGVLREAIIECVRIRCPGASPIVPTSEPAVGALLLALEACGMQIDTELTCRLERSMSQLAG